MRLHLVAIGTRVPAWVEAGYADYARRLPRDWPLQLIEIPAIRRGIQADPARLRSEEGARLLARAPAGALRVALDTTGSAWSSEQLAAQLAQWRAAGAQAAFLIGGPDGIAAEHLRQADAVWSLSRLTFPHALVRVIVAEQLYRAVSWLGGHPYHR